jgi:hypothetical protein
MRISNPDRSPLGINGRYPAQTRAAFLEIVGDDFPVLHAHAGTSGLFQGRDLKGMFSATFPASWFSQGFIETFNERKIMTL